MTEKDAPRILVFQHMPAEHPGIFRRFFAADGITWHAVHLYAGEPIPPLDGFDALWVMGGAQDAWEEDKHPWLVAEKAAIRDWVCERGKPYLGICLGHQLLADALGGAVGRAARKEVGLHEVALTEEGRASPLFAGLGDPGRWMQWHHAEVKEAPPGAKVLASSAVSPVQAIQIGAHALGIQFHSEMGLETFASWSDMPNYIAAIEDALGPGAYDRLLAEARRDMPAINAQARLLYENFMTAAGLTVRLRAAPASS